MQFDEMLAKEQKAQQISSILQGIGQPSVINPMVTPEIAAQARSNPQLAALLEQQNPMANYRQRLGQLAQLDPQNYAGAFLEQAKPMSPLEELEMQIKRAQLESMAGDRQLKQY
ncbi:hypothetical protein WHJ47_14375, partial [Staphylococcus aureus]|uniref:hypothetical protein n=1 Tax=Staphylococcus aureus TaxID=1280 RepID=UPI0039BE23D9